MDKLTGFIVKLRIPIILSVLLIAAVCFFAMDKVGINYDNASYLDDNTSTAKALKLMDKEFQGTGNLLMMVPEVSKKESDRIEDEIAEVDNVLTVSQTRKGKDTLFAILTDGNDYSDELAAVYEELDGKYGSRGAVFGGSGIDNSNLHDELTTQIVYILGISLVIVFIILIITATSYLEPVIFLFVAGIGIIINRGTNIFLGDISYITNAVAAILQLALSMDYSIMLLHRFHVEKELESDRKKAMASAVRRVLSPISCSALTTIAGLAALVFMNFKIGFDIGSVLIKGIVISALLVFTMLPGLLIIFDNALEKTKKKPLNFSPARLSKLASKHCIPVVLLSILLIGTAGYFSFENEYFFAVKDNAPGTDIINEEFGVTNTLVMMYRDSGNEKKEIERQEKFRKSLDGYKIKEYISYENTALEKLSIEDVEKRFNLSHDDAVYLFTMYELYKNEINPKMTSRQCIEYILSRLQNEAGAGTVSALQKMLDADEIVTSSYSYDELYSRLRKYSDSINKEDIRNVYALYEFKNSEKYAGTKVPFMTMVSYMKEKGYGDKKVLNKLENGLQEIDDTLSTEYTAAEFSSILAEQYDIDPLMAAYVSKQICPKGSLSFREYLYALDEMGYLPEEKKAELERYEKALKLSKASCTYADFGTAADSMSKLLTGEGMDYEKEDVKKLYMSYFMDNKGLGSRKYQGREMIDFMLKQDISNSQKDKLRLLLKVNGYLNDNTLRNYEEMAESLSSFAAGTGYGTVDVSEIKMSGVYISRAVDDKAYINEKIEALKLCTFINDNMESNELLAERMTKKKKQEVKDSMEDIETARKLFKGDKYSRLIIRTGLPIEGAKTEKFVGELYSSIDKYYDGDAQIAGNIVVINDLRSVFESDLKLISIATVLSIFAIILLTFLSASIPVILVLIIQGAIWMSMCTSVITESPIFFMGYVVALCVLMGATIDYAILMTSNYLSERKTKDKAEAIQGAIETALPTILTSGLILITAGLTVHYIATETAISTVGLLIGKGAVFSVLAVLLALPSFLVLLDKIIMKTTYKK